MLVVVLESVEIWLELLVMCWNGWSPVSFNGFFSDDLLIQVELPQDSVLSPLSFIMLLKANVKIMRLELSKKLRLYPNMEI